MVAMWKNSAARYGMVAKLFHWVMAVLVFGMLGVGLYMVDLPISPDKFKIYGWHKAFGVTVFVLVSARLVWRLVNVVPVLPSHLNRMQRFLAHGAHYLLYGALFAMPLSGWLMSSFAGFSVSFFGLFQLPDLVAADKIWFEWFQLLPYLIIRSVNTHHINPHNKRRPRQIIV